MGILMTPEENREVYIEWFNKQPTGVELEFNELDDARNRAQLKKVVEYLQRESFKYKGAAVLPYRQVLEALKKEAGL